MSELGRIGKAGHSALSFVASLWTALRAPSSATSAPWAVATRACGLARVDVSTWTTSLDQAGPRLRVQFKPWMSTDDSGERHVRGTYVMIDAPEGGLVGITLWPETAATARAKQRGAREIETGDEHFDADFYVTGSATACRAVLNAETRDLLSALLVEVDLTIAAGVLKGLVPLAAQEYGPPLLPRELPLMLAGARRLARTDVPAALAVNARSDPHPVVRLHNLMSLLRDYPGHEATAAVLRASCADASDHVRVRAAIALGLEGQATLLEIARCNYAEDAAIARAVAALDDSLPAVDLHAILSHALRTRRLEAASACLAALGRRADAEAIETLTRVLALEKGGLGVAAAQSLGRTGEEAAVPPLLDALMRDVPAVQGAAAEALGRVGTAGAILPLKELETRTREDAVRRAARQAVAAIQARLPGASHGQLSLAEAGAGALSLAEDETGRLSLEAKTKP